MRIVLMLLLLVGAFAPTMSAENFFSDQKWVTFVSSEGSVIERNPYVDEVLNGTKLWDSKTNTNLGGINTSVLPSGFVGFRSAKFDALGNVWLSHLKGVTKYNLATQACVNFTTANGIPSDNAGDLALDKANSRLLLGTAGGFASAVLNSSGLPSGNWGTMIPATTDKVIHAVGYWQDEMWAFNTDKVYKSVNGVWKTYDIGVGACFVGVNGDVWATVLEGQSVVLYKLNRSSDAFEKVPVSGVAFPGGSIVVDRDQVIWLAGAYSLVQIDLKATPLVAKNMADSWLNTNAITLKLNPVGGVIVGAIGAKEDTTGLANYYKSIASSVVRPRTQPFTIAENAKFVGIFSVNGKMVANPSSMSVLSSGNYFSVYRTADGSKIINHYLGLNSQSFPR